MKEHAKTGLLLLLVALSFYLSWRLFWPQGEGSGAAPSAGTPILFPGSVSQVPDDLFSPFAVTDWRDGLRWTPADAGIFPEVQSFFRRALRAIPEKAWREADLLTWDDTRRGDLELEWLGPVSLAAALWKPGDTGCRAGEDLTFRRLSLREDEEGWVLGMWEGKSGREVSLPLLPDDPGRLLDWLSHQPGEPIREAKLPPGWEAAGPLPLPASLPEVAAIPIKWEEFPAAVHVAEAFFPDMAVVRQIDLSADQVLFTDRQSTLHLDRNLRYEALRASFPGSWCLGQAMGQVGRFVARHGGWPEEPLLLWNLSQADGQLEVAWAQRVGFYPAVDLQPPLSLRLDGQGVRNYERRLFRPLPLLPGQKGLKVKDPLAILKAWTEEGGQPFPVEAIFLVWRLPGDPPQPQVLMPTWLFLPAEGSPLWAHAWTGDILPAEGR